LELDSLFDYTYYVKYVDDVFKRLGLADAKKGRRAGRSGLAKLAPRAV
jgi:hypothetical protein